MGEYIINLSELQDRVERLGEDDAVRFEVFAYRSKTDADRPMTLPQFREQCMALLHPVDALPESVFVETVKQQRDRLRAEKRAERDAEIAAAAGNG